LKLRSILLLAPVLLISACTVSSEEWEEKLASQTVLPTFEGTTIFRTGNQSIGQDNINDLRVTMSPPCLDRWRQDLQESADYNCEGLPLACTRYDEQDRFDEEWATVTFIGPTIATVRLAKI